MGVASGCGCKEVYRFPIPTPLVSVLFCSITIFFLFIHTYGRLPASHSSHMKVAHTVLNKKKHTQTNASYPAMDISCMPSRGSV